MKEKIPNELHGVVLLHDNADITKEAIQTHDWEVLPLLGTLPIWDQQISTSFNLFEMLCTEFRSILMQKGRLGW